MHKSILLKGGTIINEGIIDQKDVLIKDGRISRIDASISESEAEEINCEGLYIMPGVIDDQVHFREPGLTHKANIASESAAAVAGGTTTFMEMPNTKPACLTQDLLQDKYDIAAASAYSNYSFFMGAGNDNLEEVLRTDPTQVCGVKVFMGSSTGNMLVDNPVTLDHLFSEVPMLIATHCEDEATIRQNMADYQQRYGDDLHARHHPLIRNVEGCYLSSSMAVELARKHNTRLHILHISTERELELFTNNIPLSQKRITAEVCVHHLYFDAEQYEQWGNKIKCNPAIKAPQHKAALLQALKDDRLDIIATDHAPHTIEEKSKPYSSAPSGLPLVQHSLYIMLDFYERGLISLEQIVEKMCHAPAECFQVKERGYLREGYYADIVVVNPEAAHTVQKGNILYKCGWSPLEGKTFNHRVEKTIVNGQIAFDRQAGKLQSGFGMRLTFDR